MDKVETKPISKLPRTPEGGLQRTFEANGNTYKIRSADEGVSILRWSAYEKLALMLGYNATLQQIHDNQKKAVDMLNKILLAAGGGCQYTPIDVIQHLQAQTESLKKFAVERYNKAMLLCTIFIVKDSEDLHQWNQAEAQEKIEDWIAEGLDVADFFLLARIFSPQWNNLLKEEAELS